MLQEVIRLSRALDASDKELVALREAKVRAEDETAEARLESEQFAKRAADQRECGGTGTGEGLSSVTGCSSSPGAGLPLSAAGLCTGGSD